MLVGGTLASGGSMAVNMWYERDIDPLMERTENRPIQSGFISANHALIFGICISLLGVILVSTLTNTNAGIITALSALFYTVVYTMLLKRRTPQNIVIGGLAGSTPPAIGWAAASNNIFDLAALANGIDNLSLDSCPFLGINAVKDVIMVKLVFQCFL